MEVGDEGEGACEVELILCVLLLIRGTSCSKMMTPIIPIIHFPLEPLAFLSEPIGFLDLVEFAGLGSWTLSCFNWLFCSDFWNSVDLFVSRLIGSSIFLNSDARSERPEKPFLFL